MWDMQIGKHAPKDETLLNVLLTEEGQVWLDDVEKLDNDCSDASEECGPRRPFHLLVRKVSDVAFQWTVPLTS